MPLCSLHRFCALPSLGLRRLFCGKRAARAALVQRAGGARPSLPPLPAAALSPALLRGWRGDGRAGWVGRRAALPLFISSPYAAEVITAYAMAWCMADVASPAGAILRGGMRASCPSGALPLHASAWLRLLCWRRAAARRCRRCFLSLLPPACVVNGVRGCWNDGGCGYRRCCALRDHSSLHLYLAGLLGLGGIVPPAAGRFGDFLGLANLLLRAKAALLLPRSLFSTAAFGGSPSF